MAYAVATCAPLALNSPFLVPGPLAPPAIASAPCKTTRRYASTPCYGRHGGESGLRRVEGAAFCRTSGFRTFCDAGPARYRHLAEMLCRGRLVTWSNSSAGECEVEFSGSETRGCRNNSKSSSGFSSSSSSSSRSICSSSSCCCNLSSSCCYNTSSRRSTSTSSGSSSSSSSISRSQRDHEASSPDPSFHHALAPSTAAAAALLLLLQQPEASCAAEVGAAAAAAAAAGAVAGVSAELASILSVGPEPANALSLPTWIIHVASVVEWIVAMQLVWQYGGVSRRSAWRGLTWAMVPLLLSAMCACTWHFFYNSPQLEALVAIQSFFTLVGNCTLGVAAFRIWQQAEDVRRQGKSG